MIYIFNHVFIPRIEFWTQLKILPPNFMEQIMHSFFNTFKKKLKLSVSTPDAIFNEHLYNFRKIQDNQMQAKVTNILLQLNDQSLMGLLLFSLNIKFHNNDSFNNLFPYNISLYDLLLENYYRYSSFFQKHHILFLEQILDDQGYLLSKRDIRAKFNLTPHVALKWYNNLINNLNNNTEALRILNQAYGQHFDSAPLKFNQFSAKSERIRKEKNHSAKPILINADNRSNPFIGTPAKRTNFNDVTFDLEHYNIISHIGNHMEIQRCEGCDDTTSFFSPSRPHRHQQPASYCNVNVSFNNTVVLYTGTTSKGLNSRIIPVNQDTYNNVLSTIPTTFLSQQQNIQSPRPINQSIGDDIFSSSLDLTNNNNNFFSSDPFFHNFELNAKSEELFVIQNHLKTYSNLTFHTDGSLINANTSFVSMTAGFLVVSDSNTITHSFTTTLENWPSSLRAEISAILFSLIVSPHNCYIDIFTDSQNAINMIEKLSRRRFITPREFFKFSNNNVIWNNIHHLIHSKNLSIRFKKVKAHMDNVFNNHIDLLCKQTHSDLSPMLIIKENFFNNLLYLPCWDNFLIERRLRTFIKYYNDCDNFLTFLSLSLNRKYVDLIDWKLTLIVFNNNGDTLSTDFTQHKKKLFKYNMLAEQLPVLEKTKKQFHSLYSDAMCLLCHEEFETFSHIWNCSYHDNFILRTYNKFKNSILDFILDQQPTVDITNLSLEFDALGFYTNLQSQLLNQFTFIDILKGFVPLVLCNFLNSYLSHSQLTELILRTYNNIYDDCALLWQDRCTGFSVSEEALGFTRRIKRFHRYKSKYNIDHNFSYSLFNLDYFSINSFDFISSFIRNNIKYIDYYTYRVT
ncbi:ribonuclease H-like domain-containing protein [Rhizophagus clarus]|uniref:Ribonuclease H-like domain-containing protein n=1 Tax=Rhizophagus clarus TaxID=94130 RepID=A0A8H3M0H1_9GLOM|nr:ribonuclease H-like domain-containing protein [Rhizophagus clarus]